MTRVKASGLDVSCPVVIAQVEARGRAAITSGNMKTGGLAYSGDAYSAVVWNWPLPCVAAGGVVGPGSGGVGPLPLGGGVVEAEGFGDDGGGGLEDELAQGGDPGSAHGE